MRIIKKGCLLPEESPMSVWMGTHRCRSCGCVFELDKEDYYLVTPVPPASGVERMFSFECPSCKKIICLSSNTRV